MAHSKKHRAAISRGLKAYHKGKGGRKRTGSKRKYSLSQRRALEKSKTSKSGHKSYKKRMKQKRPGLWANYWNKRKGGR